MKKYGIDIVDEWGDSPEYLRGVEFFDSRIEAFNWGERNTNDNDPTAFGFIIFESDTDKVIYHSFSRIQDELHKEIKNKNKKNKEKISRFELMDLDD